MVNKEEVGPGWVMRDLSEIKPGSFVSMKSNKKYSDDSRLQDIKNLASNDPKYKYYKRFMPQPRYAFNQNLHFLKIFDWLYLTNYFQLQEYKTQ